MAEYYLKNETTSDITVDDLGLVIAAGQSITIDQNDFDGYLTDNLIGNLNTLLSTDPSYPDGLVLSDTDIGDSTGDFTREIAIERLTLKTRWKPGVATFTSLPLIGNEESDVRLVRDEGVLYYWQGPPTSEWHQLTSTFSLTVGEYWSSVSGDYIENLIFVQQEDDVYIDGGNNTAYIGPPSKPLSLNGQNLDLDQTLYTGRLSQSNVNYKTGDGPGSSVNYILSPNTTTLTFRTPVGDRADYGDKGLVTLYHNDTAVVSIDLAANFNEANRSTSQNLADYDVQGNGDPIVDGVAEFTGSFVGFGNMRVVSVGQYNNFLYYQRWQVEVEITNMNMLRQGYNSFYIEHSDLADYGGTQTSNMLDIFYDTDTGANPSISGVLIGEDVPVLRWLSGVSFYDNGSTWDLDFSAQNAFNNVYHDSEAPVVLSGWPGLPTTPVSVTDTSVSGVSTPPDLLETMAINNYNVVQSANQMSEDARVNITPRDPYGSYTSAQSNSNNYLIYSYPPSSTVLREYFRDENYRLPDGAYDTIPASITGQWDSTQSLETYDGGNGLQVYMDELVFPTIDFTTFMPTGNPDYSVLAAGVNKVYVRAFQDTSITRASGVLRMTGITKSQLYNREVRVWIKVPTQTGWLDLTRDYNYATFTGIDEDGCWINRDIQTNSDFSFTLDRFRTEDGGFMVIVKVQYPDSAAPVISHMEITNWG